MKNSVKTIITGAVCAAIAITGIGAGSVLTSAKLAEKKSIGSEAAYSAALNDAGVVSEKASEIKIDFERENGKYVFEVEFDADDKEYDYLVDAKNGDIISRKVENKDESNFANLTKTPSQTITSSKEEQKENTTDESTSSVNLIVLEEAKNTALKDAGLKSSEVTFTKAKLDDDNHYDVEFYTSSKKYEYEISAVTGKIIDKEIENFSNTSSTTVSSSANKKITLDEAKNTALKDAGLKVSEVTFTKAKLDDDNHYDVEFYTSSKKYEYEISALTGKIIDKETENLKVSDTTTEKPSGETIIGVDKAKEIALKKAGLKASDVRFIKAKLDFEDGAQVYEIEFISGGYEYEAEINAHSGNIIDFSREIDD